MDINQKKNILLSVIDATQREDIIDHLITTAWAMETAGKPPDAVVLKEGKPPRRPYGPRKSIVIHGMSYPSLRAACLNGYGMTETEYTNVCREYKKPGVVLEDLFTPRREPARRRISEDGAVH